MPFDGKYIWLNITKLTAGVYGKGRLLQLRDVSVRAVDPAPAFRGL